MKTRRHSLGSALVLALLLIAVAGALIAGWVAIVTARSGYAEQATAAAQRRIAYENSRALAQEFLLEQVLPQSSGAARTASLADAAWGGISAPAWNAAPLLSLQLTGAVNFFNPGNGNGYLSELLITLTDGDTNPTRRFQFLSRSPVLAGSVLTVQTPTLAAGASQAVAALNAVGSAMIWGPAANMTPTVSRYAVPSDTALVSFTTSAGVALPPTNLAFPPQAANPRAGGTVYGGQFDAIDNAAPAANSSLAKATGGAVVNASAVSSSGGITSDGNGTVTIVVNTLGLNNVVIPGEVQSLTLTGQALAGNAAADDLPAMLIVVNQALASTRDLQTITLAGNNNRRVALAVKKANGVATTIALSAAAPTWRLLLELENTPVTFNANGIATLQGGIRSDRGLALGSGGLRLVPEPDGKFLERLATRTAWVESYAP